jgi:hypothetical protein
LFTATEVDSQEKALPQELPDEAIDSELQEVAAVQAIDSDLEDIVSTCQNRPAELPTRSRRYGVGKEIGYAVYVHRNYEERLGTTIEWAKRHLPEHYDYDVVKLNQRNDSVSFIQCPGFDAEHEPAITAIIVVNASGQVQRRATPSDPYIYHHKWLFVPDDYPGFNVAESKARSEKWIALSGVDRSRIGRLSFWEENVVPRLNEPAEGSPDAPVDSPPDTWVKSAVARKLLKLTSCELAHKRESGEIEAKKVGNAYLYKLPQSDE